MMSKEIVVWCDKHMVDKDERVAGSQYVVAIGTKRFSLDLCGDCFDQYLRPVQEMGETLGVRDGDTQVRMRGAQPPGDYPCLWCDVVLADTGALRRHIKVTHGFTADYGDTCPDCGRTDLGAMQSLPIHMTRKHGYASMAEGFKENLRNANGIAHRVMERNLRGHE